MQTFSNYPLVFSGDGLDRLVLRRTDESWLAASMSDPATRFVPVAGEDNLLDAGGAPLLLDAQASQPLRAFTQCKVLLGKYRGHVCFALGLTRDASLPAGAVCSNLRPQFGVLEDDALALLGYARAMAHWQAHHRFCGRCGAATVSRRAGHELHCPRCDHVVYPRVNPAVIMLVTHGDRCLLGRQPGWIASRYSTLAGFVEPGENLEMALMREVQEETNIRVSALRYAFSQPWPYPAALMLGFRAEAENTDIRLNDGELAEARWFSRQAITDGLRAGTLTLPTPGSGSHMLIREWLDAAVPKNRKG
jgi:NAD+ diphosphatase